jgi:hypothetical protein
MDYRFLLLFGAVSTVAAQTAVPPLAASAPQAPLAAPQVPSAPPQAPVIRFEDASDKAGIDFTHSFGSRQLGSTTTTPASSRSMW